MMDKENLNTALDQQLKKHGYQGRIVRIQRLRDLEEEIVSRHSEGLLDETLYQERLTGFDFSPPKSLPNPHSLIVIAYAQPQVRFTFTWNGKQIHPLVPPTYLHSRQADKYVEDTLVKIMEPMGYRVVRAELPKKLLAVRSGLAVYGRNNITYIAGMGSFYRLAAFYSDLPCQQDDWQEPGMMAGCQNCLACLRHCPTGAITSERFLVHGEKCLTFHNYRPDHIPFPAWLDHSWHHCLVGCLRCQEVCPENKDFLTWVEEGAEFFSEETALLLEGIPSSQFPEETIKKLEGLFHFADRLPRNLKVLFDRDYS